MPDTLPTLPPALPETQVGYFVGAVTQNSLEERIVQCLMVDIPELWRREFRDADKTDLPEGLVVLIGELEHWCDVDFETTTDD